MEISLHRFINEAWDEPPSGELDSAQTLIIVFAASRPSPTVTNALPALKSTFPNSVLIGCSSSGEIYGVELNDDSIVLAIVKFADTRLKLVNYPIANVQQSATAGNTLAEQLIADDLAAVFTLTDGLLVNGSAFVEALSNNLPEGVVITGGLAGDGDRFEKTWVLFDGETRTGQAAAVGFYGDTIRVAHGSRGGWNLLGPDREVTKAEGNVLYSLDGLPALQVYKKYLGDRAEGLPATGLLFPLAIRDEEDIDGLTVRTILAVDKERQSITFAGDVPEGRYVKLMRANFDRLVDGAASAAKNAELSDYTGSNAALHSHQLCREAPCARPKGGGGDRGCHREPAGRDPQIGYYSYGEISPLVSGRCDLHNQTMTLTLIWEKE
ncbi:FIST signal transduction protein [Solemya velesiana gill symbiont]|uniref:FIST signal transduction protein n=1 Tax=Solemya velesiana gill symbiont TaxID=1918948 RepID=UPI001FEBBDBF|nr:FIST N-terminal domain-containing protein [Solemya velesiana gill symbiont]